MKNLIYVEITKIVETLPKLSFKIPLNTHVSQKLRAKEENSAIDKFLELQTTILRENNSDSFMPPKTSSNFRGS